MQKQQLERFLIFLYHEFKSINVQFVESKSNRYFYYKVQVKIGLRELKIEL
jgi:hypothetical protein